MERCVRNHSTPAGWMPPDLLAGSAEAPWLEDGEHRLARSEARERVRRLARRLAWAGLRPGDRVAWLPQPETAGLLAALAALEAGAELALLPQRETPARLEEEIRRLEPRLVLAPHEFGTHPTMPPHALAALEPLPATGAPAGRPGRLLLRSSGSGGAPRWLVHRLESLFVSAAAAARHLRVTAADRWLLSLPLDHVGGLGILLRSLVSGCRLCLPGPEGLAGGLRSHAPTLLSLVPAQLARLAMTAPPAGLRVALLGGAPLDQGLRERAWDLGWPVVSSYGASETGSLVCAAPLPIAGGARSRPGGAGSPFAPHRLEVDMEGRIAVTTPCLFTAELDEAGRPQARQGGDWRSGDLGRWEEGELVVLGRADRLIISGGEKIRPEEVEEALRSLPEVRQAAVVAIPDPVLGRRPAAFVTWSAGPLPALGELRRRLEPLLARHKHPARIWPWPVDEALDWKPSHERLGRLAEKLLGRESEGS